MKRWLVILPVLLMLISCTSNENRIEQIIDEPTSLWRDPHFAEHQEKLDNLESDYLAKEITYDEYLKEKKKLEDLYTKEVQHREAPFESYR